RPPAPRCLHQQRGCPLREHPPRYLHPRLQPQHLPQGPGRPPRRRVGRTAGEHRLHHLLPHTEVTTGTAPSHHGAFARRPHSHPPFRGRGRLGRHYQPCRQRVQRPRLHAL